MFACLEEGRSFRLEAGAGAGKTYSLDKALRRLIVLEAIKRDFVDPDDAVALVGLKIDASDVPRALDDLLARKPYFAAQPGQVVRPSKRR